MTPSLPKNPEAGTCVDVGVVVVVVVGDGIVRSRGMNAVPVEEAVVESCPDVFFGILARRGQECGSSGTVIVVVVVCHVDQCCCDRGSYRDGRNLDRDVGRVGRDFGPDVGRIVLDCGHGHGSRCDC